MARKRRFDELDEGEKGRSAEEDSSGDEGDGEPESEADGEPDGEPDAGPEYAVLDRLPNVNSIILKKARRLSARLEQESQAPAGSARPLLDQYDEARRFALPLPVSGPITRPEGVRTTSTRFPIEGMNKGKVLAAMTSETTDMTFANNVRQAGKWNDAGSASGPTPKNAVRDLQFLTQISQLLLSVVDATEVEAMVVNDRILVSANEASAVRDMLGQKLSELAAGYEEQGDPDFDRKAAKLQSTINTVSDVDDRLGERRMARLAVDSTVFPAQAAGVGGVLETLRADQEIVDGGQPEAAAAFIQNPAYVGRVIAVAAPDTTSPTTCRHAEQSLALALAFAGWDGPATVAGGKRACTYCYVTLSILKRRLCPQLRFTTNPGGAWTGTTATGVYGIAVALSLNAEQFEAELAAILPEVEQHVTAASRTAPSTAPVDDLGAAVSGRTRGYRTDTGTPSESEVDDSSDDSSSGDEEEEEESDSRTRTTRSVGAGSEEEEEEEEEEEM